MDLRLLVHQLFKILSNGTDPRILRKKISGKACFFMGNVMRILSLLQKTPLFKWFLNTPISIELWDPLKMRAYIFPKNPTRAKIKPLRFSKNGNIVSLFYFCTFELKFVCEHDEEMVKRNEIQFTCSFLASSFANDCLWEICCSSAQ